MLSLFLLFNLAFDAYLLCNLGVQRCPTVVLIALRTMVGRSGLGALVWQAGVSRVGRGATLNLELLNVWITLSVLHEVVFDRLCWTS